MLTAIDWRAANRAVVYMLAGPIVSELPTRERSGLHGLPAMGAAADEPAVARFPQVRRQVCKRLKRHMHDLQLVDFAAYRARLENDPTEWGVVDRCCHITISRFFRDRGVFETLRRHVLPDIAACAKQERRAAQIWSAGCAAGEEPYTLRTLWDIEIASLCPDVPLIIIATDIDETMLARAREGCFAATSLRELPPHLVGQAFDRVGSRFCVKPCHREGLCFLHQDIRSEAPTASFDLVLCRYLAFTYFAPRCRNGRSHAL